MYGLAICLLTEVSREWFYSHVESDNRDQMIIEKQEALKVSRGVAKTDQNDLQSPVVSGGVKGFLDMLSRFVTVGGDFA